ncbi:elongation of very long chain fatty acids protein baldspot isoform X1 [Oratosquilla oratoria]|uniref:elongation of very long chain fatty acids protein baldspot isoform X1 n=1 Tax=Oratosquilla oratoria TaxID=337810 RepID=UPI003F7657AF
MAANKTVHLLQQLSPTGVYFAGSTNYTYYNTFPFEENFPVQDYIAWMEANWWHCFYYITAYVAFLAGGQRFMKDRPKYDLRAQLVAWNIALAIFSSWGCYRTALEMGHILSSYGFKFSYCNGGYTFLDNRVGGFWNWMFTLSKVPELGDTVFIVLRKQPLIFLHWYHHVTVLLYAWYSYSDYIATARWFVCMNYMVHSVMYSYYALKALRFKVPRGISMAITTAQLAQMVMGAAVNIWAYQVKQAGQECHVSYENIKISLLMYTSYFVLFARFFNRAYFMSKIQDPKAAKKGEALAYEHEKNNKGKID